MKITKLINKFIVFKESNIFDALNKINQNKRGAVFILDYDGTLKGMITDGIFRRWATENKKINLEDCVTEIMNTDITTHLASDNTSAINESFSKKVKIIPLIDDKRRLVSIAVMEDDSIQIGKHTISEGSSCFIIAEIGNNHNGDIELAKNMVDLAVEAGADCVKFQMRNVGKLYKNNGKSDDISADLGTQYVLDLLCRFQLSNNDLLEVFDYCKGKGKEPLCTPWDLESLKILEDYGMLAYKVSSADMTNTELLAALSRTNKPLICSTGMSTEVEIKNSIAFLNDQGARYIMLHCNSTYPTPFKDVNLSYLSRLRRISGNPVGYSGHERGFITPVVAVGLGACIIEKHFTIDKNMEGNDHKVSLLPNEFKEMVDQIRLVEEVMGTDSERFISQGESMNREVLAKSLVINQNLNAGEVITREMIEVKSPGQGLQPYLINELVGKKAKKFFSFGDYFFLSDIQDNLVVARNYKFNRPFGIPVRYHDYMGLSSKTNVDFIEFHLSYKDLEEDISALFDKVQDIGFAVHSPELFFGDHILNLCSNDLKYLNHSINELQNVVNITRTLKPYFPNTKRPVIVTNVGGFSNDGFLPKEKRIEMYEKISNSLDKIDSENVEIIIQTMPPFPWHFGGQGFHNLFVNPNEIAAFCEKTGYRICLDISHSQMACSFYKWSLEDFIKKVGKYVAHLHIVDSLGVDGEGVQIGEGDVDFTKLGGILDKLLPNVQFIPEIWQGHKQQGAGFWLGLDFLEDYL